jgi:hypothetical protein
MRPQRLDITLAFKAICLSDVLTGTEKQVAAVIVDSFNYRTGQCDPSFDRIGHLVGKCRRTVIRAVKRLVKAGFFSKVKHGGKFHRNAYEPNWVRFRSMEASWNGRRRTRHWGPETSLSIVTNICHAPGDVAGTQTIPINQSKETSPPPPSQRPRRIDAPEVDEKVTDRAVVCQRSHSARFSITVRSVNTDTATAARTAAERRWHDALFLRLRDKPELYGQAVEAIDLNLQTGATEAELARKGTGVRYILDQLVARGLNL